MSFETDFFAWVSTQTAVTNEVSTRLYPDYLPQGVQYPAVRFEIDSDGGFKDFDGQGSTVRIEIRTDCISATKAGARAVADALKSVMKNFSGAMGSSFVDRIFLETEFSAYEPNLEGGMFRASQSWTLHQR